MTPEVISRKKSDLANPPKQKSSSESIGVSFAPPPFSLVASNPVQAKKDDSGLDTIQHKEAPDNEPAVNVAQPAQLKEEEEKKGGWFKRLLGGVAEVAKGTGSALLKGGKGVLSGAKHLANGVGSGQIDLLFANNGIAHELDTVLLLDDMSM